MKYEELLKELKTGKYQPIYFLHGNEPYYIDQLTQYFENKILSEAEKSFNLTILYGKDVDHKTVIDNTRRFPMMSSHQVVILKEAQHMKQLQDLDIYLENPLDSTILVICYKHQKLDKRTKFAKILQKYTVLFESNTLYDNQVPGWITNYLKSKSYTIKPDEAALISEYLGNDLSKISNELDKLMINLSKDKVITKNDIQTHIGISKDFNVFELQRALSERDLDKTYRIIHYFMSNLKNNPLVMVVAMLYSYFSKIYILHFLKNVPDREVQKSLGLSSPYFVKEYRKSSESFSKTQTEKIINILRTYDLKSKGVDRVNFSEQGLMQEMIYHILSC